MVKESQNKTTNYQLRTKNLIIGIDEVGRGPLAGPITVAALVLPASVVRRGRLLRGIRDCKKFSARQRQEWFLKLTSYAGSRYAVASVGPGVIDRCGIVYAASLAIQRCLKRAEVSVADTHILLDGGIYAPRPFSQETIIKGDEKIPIIAAASIIAKVTRDRGMIRRGSAFPEYGFARHKGYGTKMHLASIKKYGLSPHHRRSFCRNIV